MRIGITVEDRSDIRPLFSFLILVASLLAGLVAMGIVFAAGGKDPVMGIFRIFRSGFFSSYGIAETFSRALPLMLVGIGLAVAFRGKFWNIGAEGQILGGAMAATWVGLNCAFLAVLDSLAAHVRLRLRRGRGLGHARRRAQGVLRRQRGRSPRSC